MKLFVGNRLRHLVLRSTPVSERIDTVRIGAKYFCIFLICVHDPIEEKDDEVKDIYYQRLDGIYDCCPSQDIKLTLKF